MKKILTGLMLMSLGATATAGTAKQMSKEDVKNHVSSWPQESKDAADFMLNKYGTPTGVTENMVVWENVKPFKRSILYKEAVQHDFPMAHKDVLEHFIDYKAPDAQKVAEIWKFDGSVILERTKGEMSARCDKEEANLLALNLANQIVEGKTSVEKARMEYARQIMAMKEGKPEQLTQKLVFTPAASSGDKDRPVMDQLKKNSKQAQEE
jgi:hypothetical protein